MCACFTSRNILTQRNVSPSAHPKVRRRFLKTWCSAVCCLVQFTEDVVLGMALLHLLLLAIITDELGATCRDWWCLWVRLRNQELHFCSRLLDFIGKEWYNLLQILSMYRPLCSWRWIFQWVSCIVTSSCAAVAAVRGSEAFPGDGGMNLCTGCIQERMCYLLPKAHLLFLTLKTG